MPDSHRSVFKAIVYAGFLAGTIDIGSASVINLINPLVILHAIASGILGRVSFHEGASSALLGLVLQWGMSLLIAAIYVGAARKLRWLTGNWLRGGILYGVAIFIVMNYIVVPLSAAWPWHPLRLHEILFRFPLDKFVSNLFALMLFGLIVAFFAQYFSVYVGADDAAPVD